MSRACSCGTHTDPSPSTTRATAEQTVAEVSKRPGAREVLQRLGINQCCGAHLSLREAAAAAGVPLDDLLRALDETVSAAA
jgi:iron-sulfur cluster repair protein YtfE (RIC family)